MCSKCFKYPPPPSSAFPGGQIIGCGGSITIHYITATPRLNEHESSLGLRGQAFFYMETCQVCCMYVCMFTLYINVCVRVRVRMRVCLCGCVVICYCHLITKSYLDYQNWSSSTLKLSFAHLVTVLSSTSVFLSTSNIKVGEWIDGSSCMWPDLM